MRGNFYFYQIWTYQEEKILLNFVKLCQSLLQIKTNKV